MKGIKNFDEFIKENVVKKQSADNARAKFLIIEAERDYHNLLEMIDKLRVSDGNANLFIKFCYDILMELIRAKMLFEGYNASGFKAHEAEVSYMRVLGLSF